MERTPETLPDVRPLVGQIVERFHPQRVILFGSYAYGEPHEGSDLDLLVVMSSPLLGGSHGR
jgi:Predicted nucleotidyltransferases